MIISQITEEKYLQECREIEEKFKEIISRVNLSYPKPLNSKEERKKFFKKLKEGKVYNPQFKYEFKHVPEKVILELKEFKEKIPLKNDYYAFKRLLKQKVQEDILLLECYKTWGSPLSSHFNKQLFQTPSQLLLIKAKLYCRNFKREKVRFKRIDNKKLGKELQREVKRLTGDKLKVVHKKLANKMNIMARLKTVEINPSESFTSLDLKRLKIHEIGVHYMRYYNAKQLAPLELFQRGTDHYIATEEGLAVYSEERARVLSKAQMYIYAGRVLATYYSQKMDFYTLYHYLRKFNFKENDAFSLALRAKRNICDTSLEGGYSKDYIYFKGYYDVKAFAKKHNIKHLFFGKFKIEDYKYIKPYILKVEEQIKTIFDEEY
ncbi:MAG: tyrosine/phenylalanine carboxypeptidase domain-containing protein [Candidatus Woesearchaeota archaeon]